MASRTSSPTPRCSADSARRRRCPATSRAERARSVGAARRTRPGHRRADNKRRRPPASVSTCGESDVVAIARHERVSSQVWSAFMGYPGDAEYREFHRKDTTSGLRYWRVTSVHKGLGEKEEYSPNSAAERARDHARHFVQVVRDELAGHSADGRDPLLAVTFDSELFGHWWFEGVDWLGLVLRELTESDIRVATATEYLDREPPKERIALVRRIVGEEQRSLDLAQRGHRLDVGRARRVSRARWTVFALHRRVTILSRARRATGRARASPRAVERLAVPRHDGSGRRLRRRAIPLPRRIASAARWRWRATAMRRKTRRSCEAWSTRTIRSRMPR